MLGPFLVGAVPPLPAMLYQIKNFSQCLFLQLVYIATQIFVKTKFIMWNNVMNIGQLLFTEKFICLAILSVNSVYRFSKIYLHIRVCLAA